MIDSIKVRSPYTRNIKRYLNKDFGSDDVYMNNIKLDEYIKFGKYDKHDVFALIRNSEISAIMAVKISTFNEVVNSCSVVINTYCRRYENEKCLFIEYFNRNSKISQNKNKGDGVIMMDMLKNQCRKMNINIICLEADGVNPDKLAQNYYMKIGFIPCSEKYNVNDWTGELIFMVCDLREL